jgi:periodic tryptophan protein 1
MSMITASTWVPRGFAAPFPAKYNFDEAEFDRIAELAKLQLDDAKDDLEEAQEQENAASESRSGEAKEDKAPKNATAKDEFV